MPSQNVLFEEAGQFKTGTILQDSGQSLQIELASGKRTKVKQAGVMLRFDEPDPAAMMSRTNSSYFRSRPGPTQRVMLTVTAITLIDIVLRVSDFERGQTSGAWLVLSLLAGIRCV